MPKSVRRWRAIRDKTPTNAIDRLIATMANAQHGVVSRRDLLQAGISRNSISHRLARGRLHLLHPGVYAVGHTTLTREGVWTAAVLAGGPRAVLSHRSAAALWSLRPTTALDLTLPRSRRPVAGIRAHRLPIRADELTTVRAIPVTTVPRTLFDLAAILPRHQVEQTINEAEVRRLTDTLTLGDLLDRYPRRWGASTIEEILARLTAGTNVTRSEFEARFLDFLRETGLPPPELNASLLIERSWIECDCIWRDRQVAVELDGRATHRTAAAFERDRARDRRLSAQGWRHVRITWHQLQDEGDAIASDLARILTLQAPSSSAIRADGTAPSRRISH
jgi:very-short-patch-repair endonuclease